MNRRQQLAPIYARLLDVLGDDIAGPLVALLAAVAYVLDDNDDLRDENERRDDL